MSDTANNVEKVPSLPATDGLTQELKEVFPKLLEPSQSIRFLPEYTVTLGDPFFAGPGFDDFGKACVSTGLVSAFVSRLQLCAAQLQCAAKCSGIFVSYSCEC